MNTGKLRATSRNKSIHSSSGCSRGRRVSGVRATRGSWPVGARVGARVGAKVAAAFIWRGITHDKQTDSCSPRLPRVAQGGIHSAQQRASRKVNQELVLLYWQPGRDILDQFTPAHGGRRPQLATARLPETSCFNSRPRTAGDLSDSVNPMGIQCFNSRPRTAGDLRLQA